MHASLDLSGSLKRLRVFFLLVFALSLPFFLLGAATDLHLMPGLSVSALAAFAPMAAALVLVHQNKTSADMLALFNRSLDFKRIRDKRWLLPVLFLMPTVSLLVYGLMRSMNIPVPPAQFQLFSALLMFSAFFVGGLGEELGWSGYALESMQERWGALIAGLLLGLVGIAWHLIPLLSIGRSASWIAWWCLYALSFRFLTVWIYNNTGRSVFAAALFHATLNLAYMLFPVAGSHFDMRIASLVMACIAVVVVMVWGPKTLTRVKFTNA